jgi:phage terminase large subunit-like protein
MTTFDNLANLAPGFAQDIVARYAGTRLGRQELNAEILEDVPGALWTRETIERSRVRAADGLPAMMRIVVGVDPALTASEGAAETGIVVVGTARPERTQLAHYYVLKDLSLRGFPSFGGFMVRLCNVVTSV